MKYVNEMKYDFFFSCMLVQILRFQIIVVDLVFYLRRRIILVNVYIFIIKCDDCEMFLEILKIIEEVIDIIVFFNFDEKDDVKYVILQVNYLYKIKGIVF